MQISFSPPDISEAEIEGVVEVLKSGWITTGPKTKRLEEEIAALCGAGRAVCLSSATAALETTLRILGVGPGDEVVTSAYTYTASASVINHVGARIVLADTDPDSFHLSAGRIEPLLNERTKAVIPVDIGGVFCDYPALMETVKAKAGLFRPAGRLQEALGRIAVIADAAHAFGSTAGGVPAGGFADFTCFSFHAVKCPTTAEGGAVVWKTLPGIDDGEIYRAYMLHSLHGQTRDALAKLAPGVWEYDIEFCGRKCNMTDIAAAIGLGQLRRLPALIARRRQIVELYDAALLGRGLVSLPHGRGGMESNGHLYLARLPGKNEEQRNRVIADMAQAGIGVNVHFKPLPLMTAYKKLGFAIADFPNAYNQYRNEISLPLHTLLTDEQVAYTARTLLALYERPESGGGTGAGR
ncbi:MAG: DegT/DnrJ/EryC1/StrS family aminotransferase [Gracilibacteraceae bacterium]|nr:DegT/DnrJ/EryC1/StrS family aminotransferase [Gracilibacteraceae bacterium]